MGKLLVLLFTAFVDMIGFAMVIPLIPFYARSMGADGFLIGVLVSAFSVAQLASAPTWGRLSDRYGRRPMLVAGLIVSAAGYVVFAFAGTLWLLFLSRVVQGLGAGTVGVLQAYVTDASEPDERAKSLGWLSAATSLGAVAGPAFGSLLVQLGGHSAPGLGAASLCLVIAAFAWNFLRESSELRVSATHAVPSVTTERQALWRVLSRGADPASRLIWIYTLAIGAFYGTVPLMPLLLADRLGITEHTVGYVVMYFGAMGFVVRAALLGRAVRFAGEARLARLGLVLLAAGLAALAVTHDWATLALAITLMPLGTACLFPCITALLSRVVLGSERGLYLGVQQTFGGLSRVAFPVLTGLGMDRLGSGFPFGIAGALVAATLLLTASLHEYGAVRELGVS